MGTKTAVIYARVSSIGDRQSTDRQVKDLSDYASYQKMEVRKVFEEHISGAKKRTLHLLEKQDRTRADVIMKLTQGGYP